MKKMLFSLKGILTAMSAMLMLVATLIVSYQKTPPSDISLGAVPGSNINADEITVGGVTTYSKQMIMVASSTNVCNYLSPNATTTFISARMQTKQIHPEGGSLVRYTISRAANNWASTTLLAAKTVVAGNNDTLNSTSTIMTGAAIALTDNLVTPNSWINFAVMGTSTGAGISGTCDIELGSI